MRCPRNTLALAFSLVLTSANHGAIAQTAPRRLAASPSVSSGVFPTGVFHTTPATSRTSDSADGIALPHGTRSIRIDREGEVIRSGPDGQSARRGTAGHGVRLPALEATQGHDCHNYWVRVGTDAWVCSDDVEVSDEAPTTVEQPVVPDGQIVPFQYAFAARAGVRTYRRLDDVANEDWAEELERGMAVAVVGTARVDGGTFAHTANNRWVPMRELNWARPSERAGIFYDPDEALNLVGFLRVDTRAWPTPEGAVHGCGNVPGTVELTRRDPVHIRELRSLHGFTVARLDAGWVASAAITRPSVPTMPANLAHDERWVDVDRTHQILVAFEGTRPVFATLVSTGRPGSPTGAGEFRVWGKLATTDMSNMQDTSIDTATALYTVSRVPWVMFFHDDQALHGAFWHDSFGHTHSHGCVNLAPRDAAWLYHWAPPAIPAGWTAVLPTPHDPGLRVRVR